MGDLVLGAFVPSSPEALVIHRFAIVLLASACPVWMSEPAAAQETSRPIPVQADIKWAAPAPLAKELAENVERASDAMLESAAKGVTPVWSSVDRVDRTQVYIDQPGDGRVWARGSAYKASFGSEGATFIPFFGSHAPRNFPIRLALASARVGTQPLALGARVVSIAGNHVTIERGVLDEVYVLSADSVEQTFVLGALATPGELALTIDVETELGIERDATGFAFSNAHGRVQMTGAVVIDAAGRRQALETRLLGNALEIAVPQSYLASAQFPITIDPVISTVVVDGFPINNIQADIAYNATFDRFLVVYEEVFSVTEHDVFSVFLDGDGHMQGSGTYIDNTAETWSEPRIANNTAAATFLIVARTVPAGGGAHSISARSRAAGGALGSQVIVSGPELGDKREPDVGGDPVFFGPSFCLLVYRRYLSATDSDIHARLLTATGAPASATILIDNSGASIDYNPIVSRSNGLEPHATRNWNIVWSRLIPNGNENDVHAAQVRWDGALTSGSTAIDTSSWNDRYVHASSSLDSTGNLDPRQWMITTQRVFSTDSDVYCWILSNTNTVLQTNLSLEDDINLFENQVAPVVDSNGSTFTVAFNESYLGSATDYDVYVTTFHNASGNINPSEAHALVDGSLQPSGGLQIVGKHSAGNESPRFGICWQNWTGTDGNIHAAAYDAPIGGPIVQFCFGDGSGTACPCGNVGAVGHGCPNSANPAGALLLTSGNSVLDADSLTLQGSGMPNVTTCLFYQGTNAVSTVFGDGLRCAGGTTVRLGTKSVSGGNAHYPSAGDAAVSVRGLVPGGGVTRVYQAWYRNSASFCTSAAYNLTNGVSVVWLP
jgi:hypothetical protein